MTVYVKKTPKLLGEAAAKTIADKLRAAIAERGNARLVLSTGASQFGTLEALVKQQLPWDRVTMFHLDEYIGLDESHPASFRRYLKERFVSRVPLGRAVYVNGDGNVAATILELSEDIAREPVDVGVVGIGENAHIAFNDPPADFDIGAPYIAVELDDACKRQQVREGWFAAAEDVPRQAITMSPRQIMRCRCVISPAPGSVKAEAIRRTLESVYSDPMVPATLLKSHADFRLFVDEASASFCAAELLGLEVLQ